MEIRNKKQHYKLKIGIIIKVCQKILGTRHMRGGKNIKWTILNKVQVCNKYNEVIWEKLHSYIYVHLGMYTCKTVSKY